MRSGVTREAPKTFFSFYNSETVDEAISYIILCVVELNSTASPSPNELNELANDIENDELNADNMDDEDVVEDILYMRGASFTIHLDPPLGNITSNGSEKMTNDERKVLSDPDELQATSQVCFYLHYEFLVG